ncbi:hypothetical protein K435DRAFT_787554 [Dendrothele bispora CBS 962.96]|uniref:Uncharacterized protein n=1 Tax=Dendrothele bispora (strain CBS 962.96) TaxID=1314807 RepID=A0A4S8KJD2_DENBC|nr:hypothetical protein K435DRAFT_787554 [Dendrothele bispora CBS 962.96]
MLVDSDWGNLYRAESEDTPSDQASSSPRPSSSSQLLSSFLRSSSPLTPSSSRYFSKTQSDFESPSDSIRGYFERDSDQSAVDNQSRRLTR